MTKKDNKKGICKEFQLELSDFIKETLPSSQMERFQVHAEKCSDCNKFLELEKQFELDLKDATEEELKIHDISDKRMASLESSIIESIKWTTQEKREEKLPHSSFIKPKEARETIVKQTFADSILSLKVFASLIALSIIIVVALSLLNIELSKKETEFAKNKLEKNFTVYSKKRNVSTLFGYTPVNSYNGYISAMAKQINNFPESLQKTILFRLKEIQFSRKRRSQANQSLTKN